MADSVYPPIEDYGFLSDCFSAALVSRAGSIDWLCMPRLDSGSYFARLLDRERGGYCALAPQEAEVSSARRYVGNSLVLETRFETPAGGARILDCLVVCKGGKRTPPHCLLRIVEGLDGQMDWGFRCAPMFDYGEVSPWMRAHGPRRFSAIGGDDGLLINSDTEMVFSGRHAVEANFRVRAGERRRFALRYVPPEVMDYDPPEDQTAEAWDGLLEETLEHWEQWVSRAGGGPEEPAVLRSALVLRGLVQARTGAIAAAPTTSLPEAPGGTLNWDYRYCWVRDAYLTVTAFASIGFDAEASGFRRFIERTSAGRAEEMMVLFGLGGERRIVESTVELAGYAGASPVRVGNAAAGQLQLDMYGEMLQLAWAWWLRGHRPDEDYWRFLSEIVEAAAKRWQEPDHGFWEARGERRHYVRSKVMCWTALDHGIRLSEALDGEAQPQRWRQVRDEIRASIESHGYDAQRGVWVRAYDSNELDAALLLLPWAGFVDYNDPRMIRTTQAIRDELDDNGLIRRFPGNEQEGAFLACSFWLAICLHRQGRYDDARSLFDRAAGTANDLGLLAEEYDTRQEAMLGNFPQALTHLSHIMAALALRR